MQHTCDPIYVTLSGLPHCTPGTFCITAVSRETTGRERLIRTLLIRSST